MQYRSVGKSGIEASVVGFGAWAIGGWMWGGTEKSIAIRAIRAAVDAGVNLIDTAPIYGFGLSEQIVGEAIGEIREKVIVATKCGLIWHAQKGTHYFNSDMKHINKDATVKKVHKFLGPETIRYEVEQSLKRLQIETIDIYQTHWQDSTTPICDTMSELLKLKEEGKIRAIGVSNASVEQMEQYRAVGPLDSDQEKYSMLDREAEADNLPYCAENSIAFLAYSPIAQGLLTGKMGPERTFNEGDQRRSNPRFSLENRKKVGGMLDEFKPFAETHGVGIAQLVMAWTFSQRGCSHILVGARTPQQAQENARAGDIQLSQEEIESMTAILKRHMEQ